MQKCKGCTHLNGNFLGWFHFISVSHIQYFLPQENKQLFNFITHLSNITLQLINVGMKKILINELKFILCSAPLENWLNCMISLVGSINTRNVQIRFDQLKLPRSVPDMRKAKNSPRASSWQKNISAQYFRQFSTKWCWRKTNANAEILRPSLTHSLASKLLICLFSQPYKTYL